MPCARQIPLVREVDVPVKGLADSGQVNWKRDPLDWFDFRIPDSFEIVRPAQIEELSPGAWRLPATTERTGALATFEFTEQVVGFPYFDIDAPAGTVVELITQEVHDPQVTAWMDNHFYSWSRFICREGVNHFEAFDYDSLRWLQLHVRGASRPVIVCHVGVRRRMFPWPHDVVVRCSDPRCNACSTPLSTLFTTRRSKRWWTVWARASAIQRRWRTSTDRHSIRARRAAFGEAISAHV